MPIYLFVILFEVENLDFIKHMFFIADFPRFSTFFKTIIDFDYTYYYC
jgi:hypothetical protein